MPELFYNSNFLVLLGFSIGAVLGSFLNVCAYRIPIGKSIIMPASHCPNCGLNIPWHRNLPVISWLLQKGQASCCSFRIPYRYWLVELLVGFTYAYFAYQYSKDLDLVQLVTHGVFTFLMIVVSVVDLENMIIPDRFSVGGAVFGVLFSSYFPETHLEVYNPIWIDHLSSGITSLLGMLVGSALLYWIGAIAYIVFGREAIGEGDVKLLGCVGAFCGWQGAVFAIFGGALLGTLIILPIMIFLKVRRIEQADGNMEISWGDEIPFGPFLALAGLLYMIYFSESVDNWLNPIQAIF
jgi:leader peptidase (prepilin peptidase)/N-methyltransferase